jgi:hypothetical protein
MRIVRPAGNRMSGLMRVTVKALFTGLAVMTTACGGGEEPTVAPKESQPVVTVAPPAVVAVAPPVSWGPVGLTQLSDFPTLGFAYRYTTNSDGSNAQGPSVPDSADVITISYLAADQSYEVKIPGLERGRLALVNRNPSYSSHSLATSPSRTFEVVLLSPAAANPEFALENTSFGWWDDPIYTPIPATLRSNNTGYFAYGVPTDPGDVPVSGGRTYKAVVSGVTSASAPLDVWYVFGIANLTFDFSKGALTGNLSLGVNPGGPGQQGYGNFQFASTNYTVGATRFSGKFSMPGGVEDGFFEGQFTGPQASELMVRWLLPQSPPNVGPPGSLFGVLVGKRANG